MTPEDLRVDEFIGWVQASTARETAATLLIVAVVVLALIEIGRGAVWAATHTTADRPDWWLRLLERAAEHREPSPAELAQRARDRRREYEARLDAARRRRAAEKSVAALAAAPQDLHDRILTGIEVHVLDLQPAANEHAAGNVWGTR